MATTSQPLRLRTIIVSILALLLLAFLICEIPVSPVPIQLGPDTTVITSPLHSDGTPDYIAALDAIASRGITPENNAAPLIIQALGPTAIPIETRAETLSRLNLTSEFLYNSPSPFVPWKDRPDPTRPASIDPEIPDDEWQWQEQADLDFVIDDLFFNNNLNPDLIPWLQSNAPALQLITQASRKSHFYLPMIADPNGPALANLWVPPLGRIHKAADALAARSTLHFQQGDYNAAIDDCLIMHRLAHLITSDRTLVSQLVAAAIVQLASQLEARFAARTLLPPDQARFLLDQLIAMPPIGNVTDVTDRGERFYILDTIICYAQHKDPDPESGPLRIFGARYDADWNEILRRTNVFYDDLVAAMAMSPGPDRVKAFDDFNQRLSDGETRYTDLQIQIYRYAGWPFRSHRTDAFASRFIGNYVPNLGRALDIQDRAGAYHDLVILALALHLYHSEKGTYPPALDALSPDLLPALPIDRFSGKRFIYNPDPANDSYLLYSVGPNLADNAGRNDHDSRNLDDIAISAPPLPPPPPPSP